MAVRLGRMSYDRNSIELAMIHMSVIEVILLSIISFIAGFVLTWLGTIDD